MYYVGTGIYKGRTHLLLAQALQQPQEAGSGDYPLHFVDGEAEA